ncbi:MAG: hypothetical protein M3Z32_05930, partial [Acidobacteriota bacterium]|nr:hypothetical protein [Acidobacteriota bacterium]
NPLLNSARGLRSRLAGEAEEQGEGILLSRQDLKVLEPFFDDLQVEAMNLLAIGKRLLRGHFEARWARSLLRAMELADSALLTMAPPLREWCGEALVTARRKSP